MNVNSPKGTAIYIDVCPKFCCQGQQKIHHLTLAHLATQDKSIVQYAIKRIEQCIETNYFLSDSPHGKVVSYTLGKEYVNSTYLDGNVEFFKESLDQYLRNDKTISPHLSTYRPAHIDRLNRNLDLYKEFRLNNLKTL